MGWIRKLFGLEVEEELPTEERLHCIRFMTERGEQLGMLLTHTEFVNAVQRWVDTIDTMPIDTANPNEDDLMKS